MPQHLHTTDVLLLSILAPPNPNQSLVSVLFTLRLRVNPATAASTPGGGEDCRARAPFGPQQPSPHGAPRHSPLDGRPTRSRCCGFAEAYSGPAAHAPRVTFSFEALSTAPLTDLLRHLDSAANHGSAAHPRDRSPSAATQKSPRDTPNADNARHTLFLPSSYPLFVAL